ncbi:hypothetical protein FK220_018490 [Flavobacteriaceae bacterium TP-CH-4]|uniref:Uncharacterized protein n=1 Tax=Pelagihabitans pacificus TaxID=2696054 RepID=A0A967AVU7_9FLAO|nr:hypothetical protein [Pelagihabitans pacificus]NHF61349.1 hypothetical protein [Pelagihabitans pacificus]
MGGEGSMASAILSLKQNRALLKKRSIRELKDVLREKSGKTELEFKKVDAKDLARLKKEIRKEARTNARNELFFYAISFFGVGILFYLIYLLFFG